MRIEGIRACVFDAYGTLFDFASAAESCADMLGKQAKALTEIWRDKQIQYSWLRSLRQRYVDFSEVTADGLDYAMRALGITDPALRTRLLKLYESLPLFPEAGGFLRQVHDAGFQTAILSNGSPAMLTALVRNSGTADLLDHVLSVDEARIFKPDSRTYQLAVDHLGVPGDAICFFSSNPWDAWGASDFGMRVVWCNRKQQPPENLPGQPDAEVRSLDQALALLLG